jgi:hypothetical protein
MLRMTSPRGHVAQPAVKEGSYCTYCGVDLDQGSDTPTRFGEPFCGEAHAEAFVQEARAARVERMTGAGQIIDDVARADGHASSRWNLRRTLKMAACCGLPLLALVFLVGGGGALLGAGATVLPLLAVLACPLGMFFMMRAMQNHGKSGDHPVADQPAPSKELKER